MATFTTLEQLAQVSQAIVNNAEATYRKKADKIAKTDLATDLSTEISNATSNISTLQGSDTNKSVRTISAEEVAKVVASAPESYDTLKEIADWIENDTTGAAKMANDIDDLKDKTELGTHEVSGEQVEYNTVKDYVEGYVAEQISGAELSAGNGIDITNNVVSAKIDSTNANGLAATANGLKLNAATPSTGGTGGAAGAMTAADKEKLDNADVTPYTSGNGVNITNHAVSAVVDSTNANGLAVGANGLSLAAAVASTSGAGGSAGAMSAADKEKLDGIAVATSQNITDLIDGLFPSA